MYVKKKLIHCVLFIFVIVMGTGILLKNKLSWAVQNLASESGMLKNPSLAFNRYILGRLSKQWSHGPQPTKQENETFKKYLGYNPDVQYILDNNTHDTINQHRPTLFLHGFGDMKNSAKLFKEFYDTLPGNIITFQFPDWGPGIPWIRKSSLGQFPDVATALLVLKWAKNKLGLSGVDLYGYSRGGATALNMIYVLSSDEYNDKLHTLGIDPQEKKELLSLIKNGSIVLDAPLRNLNESLSTNIVRRFANKILPYVSQYDPQGMQGLSSAQALRNLKFNILFHFQHNDNILTNKSETKLYNVFHQLSPSTTYLTLGDEGGHIHTRKSLANAIHTFRKQYNGSYDPDYVKQYENQQPSNDISGRLLQPSQIASKAVIKDYYKSRARHPKKKSIAESGN